MLGAICKSLYATLHTRSAEEQKLLFLATFSYFHQFTLLEHCIPKGPVQMPTHQNLARQKPSNANACNIGLGGTTLNE